jgi:UDP-arabinose 4-epimerase
MSTILVTGGAGYIGSHACKALAQAGYTPVCYDNLERGHKWAVKWGPLELGNILDRKRLDEVLRKYKPDAVMHFAAYAYVEESVKYPEKYYRNNVEGSITLLEAMQAKGINKFIFSSSCAVYGIPQESLIMEDHPIAPINPYGAGKSEIENKLHEYSNASDFQYVSLRYFNAAGADPDGETGELHDPETHLIPLILNTAMNKQEYISIYGIDYDTPDGTCIRDYIHVCDLADGHLKGLQYIETGKKSDIVNLGSGKGYSVKEIIDTAREVTHREIKEKIVERRPGDPPRLVANIEYAKKILDWEPQHSRIQNIIETAWQFLHTTAKISK